MNEKGVLRGDIHFGVVDEVINRNFLKVKIDNSENAQTIPCNPDIPFEKDDQVIVQFLNKNTKNKFVICRKMVEES